MQAGDRLLVLAPDHVGFVIANHHDVVHGAVERLELDKTAFQLLGELVGRFLVTAGHDEPCSALLGGDGERPRLGVHAHHHDHAPLATARRWRFVVQCTCSSAPSTASEAVLWPIQPSSLGNSKSADPASLAAGSRAEVMARIACPMFGIDDDSRQLDRIHHFAKNRHRAQCRAANSASAISRSASQAFQAATAASSLFAEAGDAEQTRALVIVS